MHSKHNTHYNTQNTTFITCILRNIRHKNLAHYTTLIKLVIHNIRKHNRKLQVVESESARKAQELMTEVDLEGKKRINS